MNTGAGVSPEVTTGAPVFHETWPIRQIEMDQISLPPPRALCHITSNKN
ncbi:hypothetical protein BC777_1365 [Yoonia maricola]|uniref:Uncharacterized protein n=1 Tax=Yoonia maricola TaxID=420999 RepID=A0A2M8WNK2_9RHOB|nr:hypothetical protein [Yoonia maricola]PJI92512.1 hypothetical protein BC777_1365 [Yoonia maricola]